MFHTRFAQGEPLTLTTFSLTSHLSNLAAAAALAVGLGYGAAAEAAPLTLDMSTTAGFAQTCKQMPRDARRLKSDDERIAWAICRDTDQTRRLITWATQGFPKAQRMPLPQVVAEVERKVDEVRREMAQTRQVLARTNLGEHRSLRIAPGQWQMDLNGDGQIEVWEKYFFAIPKRGLNHASWGMPRNDKAHIQRSYVPTAQIAVDQADVLWALSYHQFIEGLLTHVRAFELDTKSWQLTLAHPALLAQAHQLIGQGLETSDRMRHAVLAETDDEQEWIASPQQRHSVFPLVLDAEDFQTWREVMAEARATWQGEHLLPASRNARGLLGQMAPLCAEGQGLNVKQLYLKPPAKGTRIGSGPLPDVGQACQPISAAKPASRLAEMAERAASSEAVGTKTLRHLYWVN